MAGVGLRPCLAMGMLGGVQVMRQHWRRSLPSLALTQFPCLAQPLVPQQAGSTGNGNHVHDASALGPCWLQ